MTNKVCSGEDPKELELYKLKVELKGCKAKDDLEKCKKKREENNKCDKTCPGEDAKDALVWNLKC